MQQLIGKVIEVWLPEGRTIIGMLDGISEGGVLTVTCTGDTEGGKKAATTQWFIHMSSIVAVGCNQDQ